MSTQRRYGLGLSLMVVISFWSGPLAAQDVLVAPTVPYEPAHHPPSPAPFARRTPVAAAGQASAHARYEPLQFVLPGRSVGLRGQLSLRDDLAVRLEPQLLRRILRAEPAMRGPASAATAGAIESRRAPCARNRRASLLDACLMRHVKQARSAVRALGCPVNPFLSSAHLVCARSACSRLSELAEKDEVAMMR